MPALGSHGRLQPRFAGIQTRSNQSGMCGLFPSAYQQAARTVATF